MNICVDSGFLYSLYEPRETKRHQIAVDTFYKYIDPKQASNKLIIIWPILYEVINTRFIKRYIIEFDQLLLHLERRELLEFADDKYYRDNCLFATRSCSNSDWDLSLVDRVIREALKDTQLKIDALLTFNPGDFSDICIKRKLRQLCQEN
ncbi:MAG: hypothetical protein P9X24_12255 [Candidatus Hatepunaea meridiana]|nr:hypothetical protein [Candidatus Hatepunaea meridiana]